MKILALIFSLVLSFAFLTKNAFAYDKGIYINQSTLDSTSKLTRLIQRSRETGINTFVVDLDKVTRNYPKNIKLVKDNGLKYVARIVVFPKGGNISQVRNKKYWEQRYRLVQKAIDFGADEIQLDYIRYSTKQRPSTQNSVDVHEVIKWFKQKVSQHNIPLQIDIFGETSFRPSLRIGQDVRLFANSVDTVCPMVYPSHYKPYAYHSNRPFETINKSLRAMRQQFDLKPPFKIKPYIEATNFRYRMSSDKKVKYILEQIRAVEANNADGWYVWSANNQYNALFKAMKQKDNYKPNEDYAFNFAPKAKSKSKPSKKHEKPNYPIKINVKKWYERKHNRESR